MTYDEAHLIKKLETLPKHLRVVFAALCAERIVPAYSAFAERTGSGEPSYLVSVLNRLWQDLEGHEMSNEQIQEDLDACLELIRDENEGQWSSLRAYAEDAVAAVAYALRARQSGKSQEAAWAARRSYEAIDYFVVSQKAINTNEPDAEKRIIAHPLIQKELVRQWEDLNELERLVHDPQQHRSIGMLRAKAQADANRFLVA
jgi:uncharacterized protein YjaG (DUF416 family)